MTKPRQKLAQALAKLSNAEWLQVKCARSHRPGADAMTASRQEPAEPDPGPGWLRSRFMGKPYPRPNVAPCGRQVCPVCGEAPVKCEEHPPSLRRAPR